MAYLLLHSHIGKSGLVVMGVIKVIIWAFGVLSCFHWIAPWEISQYGLLGYFVCATKQTCNKLEEQVLLMRIKCLSLIQDSCRSNLWIKSADDWLILWGH